MKPLVALNTLASARSHGIEIAREMVHILNYCATHPDAVFWYKKRDMIISIQSDDSYLSDPKVCSKSYRKILLMNKKELGQHMMNNGAVHVVSTIILNVISYTVKA